MKKVSILLSIYNPNKNFLKKQLESINNQTYKNIELLIHDDCIEKRCNPKIFNECLNINYKLIKYKNENLGYSLAFRHLLENVNHNGYVAFCDQDDIWEINKIEKMVKKIEKEKKKFVFCDRKIIDENDNITKEYEVNSIITDFNDDLHKLLIGSPFRTLCPGMSILCSADFAKKTGDFNIFKKYAFDKWISCCALAENTCVHLKEPLVLYRRHSNNVSGVLSGIKSKKDYYEKRVILHHELVMDLIKKYPKLDLKDMKNFSLARVDKNIFKMNKLKWINKKITIFEILLFLIPNCLSKIAIKIFIKFY